MRWSTAVLAASQVVAVLAAPENLFARQQCNRDNCLRAVVASNASPGPTSAKNDCSSFQTTVLSPCTQTTTTTTTVTAATVTNSVTGNLTATQTSYAFVNSTRISSTATTTTATTIFNTNTTVTETTTVATVYSYNPNRPAVDTLKKRNAYERRQFNSTCGASTSKTVPTYASACSGAVRYASACACNGVSATTIAAAVTTVTSTVTMTFTPTVQANFTSFTTTTVPVTNTSTILTTSTSVNITTFSSTVTATATTTVSVTATIHNVFAIQVGAAAGQYVENDNGAATFVSESLAAADTFTLSTNGTKLITQVGGLTTVAGSKDTYNPVIFTASPTSSNTILACSVNMNFNPTAGGYALTCVDADAPNAIQIGNAWFYAQNGYFSGFQQIPQLYAVTPFNGANTTNGTITKRYNW